MRVLFFSAWYPHRYDAMAGLFVRKHAEAVAAQGMDVAVFYLHEISAKESSTNRDSKQHVTAGDWVEQTTNGVHEFYYYYSPKNRLSAYVAFWRGFLRGYERISKTWGVPDVTQANVLTKNAWCAYYLWKKFQIPYVIIEHWSGYLPANGGYKGFFHKRITERIAREAQLLLPVSPILMEAMKNHGIQNNRWELVNNVVDDFFLAPLPSPHEGGKLAQHVFTFLHVSCFDEAAKNTCGILRAVAKLRTQRQDFRLLMVGTGQDVEQAKETAARLGLDDVIVWTGEVTPLQVADYMREADCFVLFSNYETAGVILSECVAIGLPILSTPVGIAPTLVNHTVGKIVEPRNEAQLMETMSWMIDHAKDFDRATIRQHGYAYSYEAVGKQLCAIYQQILSPTTTTATDDINV